MLKKRDIYFYLKAGLLVVFLAQIMMLAVFNLTQLQYHMGYDASSWYLKAMEMAKQKTIFVKEWANQTTLYFDSAVPFAALLYWATGDIFVSYGIVNFMIDIGIFFVFYNILKALRISDLAKLVCLNMIACTYISPGFNNANDLGYFSSILSSNSGYGLKALLMLMVIKMMFDMEDGKINYLYILVTEALLFVSGISSGWYLMVTVLAPIIIYYLLRVFIYNSWKEIRNKRVILLVISMLLIFIGKMAAVHLLKFESKDSSMILTGLSVFWKNIGSIFLGFMQLTGAFPYDANQPALDRQGIVYVLGFIVFLVCMIGIVHTVRHWLKKIEKSDRDGMIICIIGFNLLMFCIIYTTYGDAIFEARYLIAIFLMVVVTVGRFIDSLDDRWIFKYFNIAVLTVVLLMLNISGDHTFLNTKNNYHTLASISEKTKELDVPVVYVCGSELGIDSRNLRVVDESRIYKFISENSFNSTTYWGDYTYYSDVALVQGKNALITTEQYFALLPEYIRNQYVLQEKIDKYLIFAADTNRFDLESGISGKYSMDYPTSRGISVSGGIIEESSGSFLSEETAEGIAVRGPNVKVLAGHYQFIINYEILKDSENTADFVITLDSGKRTLATVPLERDEKRAVVDIEILEDSMGLEYRVYDYAGTVIRVDSFEIIQVDSDE